tara:strand:- start:421 stop:939 length:519 start_codon:yes stop_codon:yes gene_type:complete
MQSIEHYNSNLIFILLTEQQSFIPNIILNRCKIIPFSKPSITSYKKLSKNKQFAITKESVNFKDIISNNVESTPLIQRKIIYKIYDSIINYKKIHFKTFRDDLYDLFIYNIDLEETIFVILSELIKNNYLNKENIENILYNKYIFLKYYNNNYRPIYHLEKFFFKIILLIKL